MAQSPQERDVARLKSFDGLPMRVGWGSYRKITDERLRHVKQLGVDDVLLTPWRYEEFEEAMPSGGSWSYEDIVTARDQVEAHDLRLYAFETMPIPLYDILVADERRDEYITEIQETIRNMGRAGVPVLGYSGHHPAGVGRTTRTKEIRGGAQTTAFEGDELSESELTLDREYSEADLWTAYEEFLSRVLPVAEEAGVTLAVHPSDPPVEEIGGLPLLFRNRGNFKRALGLVESPNHGLKLCLGCWSEMGEDIPDVIRHFKDDIVYVHFRDVVGTVPKFYETFLDDPESNYDEYEVVRALRDVGFSGVMTPDHVPLVEGEANWEFGGATGRSYTVGYIKGLLKGLRANEKTVDV